MRARSRCGGGVRAGGGVGGAGRYTPEPAYLAKKDGVTEGKCRGGKVQRLGQRGREWDVNTLKAPKALRA